MNLTAVAWKCGLTWSKWHCREYAWQATTVCGQDLLDRGTITEKPLAEVPGKDCCRVCLTTLRQNKVGQ